MAPAKQNKGWGQVKTLAKLAVGVPAFATSIATEARLTSLFKLPFPRDVDEILHAPERFFSLLQEAGALPARAELLGIQQGEGLHNEPDKQRTSGILEVRWSDGPLDARAPSTPARSQRLFVKFQNGRGLPLWLQAMRATVEWGIAREVDFYRRLAPTAPLRVPKAMYANYLPAFNRVCLVLEHTEGYNLADWRGCPITAVRAMLRDVSRLNATYFGRVDTDSRSSWIPARSGLDYASFVGDFMAGEADWYRQIWAALVDYFADHPLTLVHGDCRPGNMLFVDDGDIQRAVESGDDDDRRRWDDDIDDTEVVFLDWEATNAAPLWWDFTYCTTVGITVEDRRALRPRLLDEHRRNLIKNGVPESMLGPQRCRVEVELLTLVLVFVAKLVRTKGFWDRQGNTAEDFAAWDERIRAVIEDADIPTITNALGLPAEPLHELKRAAADWQF
ncbi:MAG: phosphotransferase [Myxococcota bacterium]